MSIANSFQLVPTFKSVCTQLQLLQQTTDLTLFLELVKSSIAHLQGITQTIYSKRNSYGWKIPAAILIHMCTFLSDKRNFHPCLSICKTWYHALFSFLEKKMLPEKQTTRAIYTFQWITEWNIFSSTFYKGDLYTCNPQSEHLYVWDRQGNLLRKVAIELGATNLTSNRTHICINFADLGFCSIRFMGENGEELIIRESFHDLVMDDQFLYGLLLNPCDLAIYDFFETMVKKISFTKGRRRTSIAAYQGKIYVYSGSAQSIEVYSQEGDFLAAFDCRVRELNGMVVSHSRIYLTDHIHAKVRVWDLDGVKQFEIPYMDEKGYYLPPIYMNGILVYENRVYVSGANVMVVFELG